MKPFSLFLLAAFCATIARVEAAPIPKKFESAVPGYKFSFPRDHNSHANYATEWWYFTGHLRAKNGRRFGYQATWFRTALAPQIQRKSGWATRDIQFAHMALTDESGRQFFFTDRIGRAVLGLNGATTNAKNPKIWIGDWKLNFSGATGQYQNFSVRCVSDSNATKGQNFSLNLKQIALKPPAIQGENGVSQKSAGAGRASHYYSYTRLQTRGTVQIGDEKFAVDGQSWFDHEFGSSQLDKNQVGWDWFSLQLSDGRELMLYQLRLKNGAIEPLSSGTIIEKNGRTRHLKRRDFRLTPLSFWTSQATGARYPARWKIEIPAEKLVLQSTPTIENQELRPRRSGLDLSYWEGSVEANGTHNGRPVSARGYVEMTGYARAFRGTF